MAKTDPTPADVAAEPTPAPVPTRAEVLAATEADNARRALDGHVPPKHIDDITLTSGE